MDPYISELSPIAIVVPLLSFIALLLDLPAFAWHIKNRNLAASCLVFWVALDNLFNFVNAILWHNDNIATWWHGAVYCDIQVKLFNAATVGLTGAAASVMRSLSIALDTDRVVLRASTAQRQRKLAIDCLLCFGLPLYMIVAHYIVQPSRFYIFAIAGCVPSFDSSWPSIAIIYIWPPISTLVAAYYCGLVIVRLRKYRKNFAAILTSSNSGLTKSRFIRLFLVALILIVLFVPVQAYVFYRNVDFPLAPYSWSRIHGSEWWQIILIPTNGSVDFDRWIQIGLGFIVFACFGLGHDAIAMYRKWLLQAGMGRIFPRLRHERLPSYSAACPTGKVSSYSSKARDFFGRKLSHDRSTGTSTSRNPSTATAISTPSPTDPEKSFPRLENPSTTDSDVSTCAEKTTFPSASASRLPSWLTMPVSRFFRKSEPRPATLPQSQIASGPSPGITTHDWVPSGGASKSDDTNTNHPDGYADIVVHREIDVIGSAVL